jgi:thiamine pyrophosphate-dependent acetolactate synthase large subunit-like protein
MNVSEAIAQILKKENIDWISCFPNNPLIEDLSKIGIRPIMFRHERGAMMAADGYSRTSDREKIGIFSMQSQAGAENSMGGVSQAYADNIPVLILPGAPPLNQISVRPNFNATSNYKGIVKSAECITQPGQVIDVMRRAFHNIRNGRPGPVVVEIPADISASEINIDIDDYKSPVKGYHAPSITDIKLAVSNLLKAKNPLIIAGQGVLFSRSSDQLKTLAELTNIPVYTTMPGKSAINEDHPLALGAGVQTTTLQARTWLDNADVILALGTSMTITPYGQSIDQNSKFIIHNSDNYEDINKDFFADVILAGDTKLTIELLIEEIKSKTGENGREDIDGNINKIADLKKQWLTEWASHLNSDEVPINPYRVINEINNSIDLENSIVTHDAGAPRDQIVPFFKATVPHSYIGWGKTTHLGFSIPLMIGAKKANPDKFCLNLMGDGAFGMSGLDIETAVRSKLAITTIILNNGGMATYPGGFPNAREKFGVSFMKGNYAKIAEGMGAIGIEVKEVHGISEAIKKAQIENSKGNTVLIDIHTGYDDKRSKW